MINILHDQWFIGKFARLNGYIYLNFSFKWKFTQIHDRLGRMCTSAWRPWTQVSFLKVVFLCITWAGICCSEIPHVNNSDYNDTGHCAGDIVTYRCHPGNRHYDGHLNKSILCQRNGLWNDSDLSCEGKNILKLTIHTLWFTPLKTIETNLLGNVKL